MVIATLLIFSLAYAIKGGWLLKFEVLKRFSDKNHGILGYEKAISVALMAFFFLAQGQGLEYAIIWTLAWIAAVHPSMGEEAGAIGRIDHWWGKYKDSYQSIPDEDYGEIHKRSFNRSYGVLKGVQRGVWMGAMFVVAGATTLSIPIMAVGFVAAHFIAQEAHSRARHFDSWAWAEPAVGLLLGICFIIGG